MGELVAILICWIIFYYTFRTIELFAKRSERRALIEKLGTFNCEANGSAIEHFLQSFQRPRGNNALKFGCLLAGVGLGLVVGIMLSGVAVDMCFAVLNEREATYVVNTVWIASAAFFGGLGLLISAIIEQKRKE